MTTVFKDIEVAIQTTLDGISGHPYISWENDIEYKPVLGTRYWRTTNKPTRSELVTTGKLVKHQGFFQVDVIAPLEQGLDTLIADLDGIYTTFNALTSITQGDTRVDILNVNRGRVQRDKSWCMGYIEIYYMCYSH